MNKLKITALATAIGLAMSASAMGAGISEAQFKSAGQGISARHTADQATCEALAGNRKDVCMAEATVARTWRRRSSSRATAIPSSIATT